LIKDKANLQTSRRSAEQTAIRTRLQRPQDVAQQQTTSRSAPGKRYNEPAQNKQYQAGPVHGRIHKHPEHGELPGPRLDGPDKTT
jgi:hypothetical protein